jgi:hypothetical protein
MTCCAKSRRSRTNINMRGIFTFESDPHRRTLLRPDRPMPTKKEVD